MEIDGTITFFYYNDLAKATEFYEETMGFEKVIDMSAVEDVEDSVGEDDFAFGTVPIFCRFFPV